MSQRSHQAGLITLAEFFRFGIKAVIGILLARMLSPAELGSYRQLFLIYTTISTLMLMGIPQSLIYFLPRLNTLEDRRIHVGKIMNLSFVLSVVFALVLMLFRGLIADKFNNPQLSGLLFIYAAYPVFMFSSSLYSYVMLGQQNASAAARFTLFSVGTDAVLILGAAFFTRELVWIVVGVIAAASLQWLYSRIRLFSYRAPFRLDAAFYKMQFAYALPLGLSSLIGMLSVQLDKIVISAFFDPASFAIFSIGAMELPFISIFTNSVNSVLIPNMSREDTKSGISGLFRAAVRKNALFIIPTAFVCYLFANQIITWLYTDTYLQAVPFFKVYLFILPLRVVTFGALLLAIGKTRLILINSIFTLVSNLILNVILVKALGMMGAAIATVIVTALSTIFYALWLSVKLKYNLREMIPWLALMKTALASLLAFVAAWLVVRNATSVVMQVLGMAVFGTIYLVLGYGLGAVLPYDIQMLMGFAGKLWQRIVPRRQV